MAFAFLVLFDSGSRIFADFADGARTEQAMTLHDAVRVWRKAAWQQDDYFSQIKLGDLYSQNQSFPVPQSSPNPSFADPVESYVWYFLALRPRHSYQANNSRVADALDVIRQNALKNAESVYYSLTFDQRLEVRARIIYILASRGSEGFITLGRLHREYGLMSDGEGDGGATQCVCGDPWWYGWLTRPIYNLFYSVPPEPTCSWKSALKLGNTEFIADSPNLCPTPKPLDANANMPLNFRSPAVGVAGGPVNGAADNLPNGAVAMSPVDNGVGGGNAAGGDFGGDQVAGGNIDRFGGGQFGAGIFGDRGPPSVFTRGSAEALMYFKIAADLGHPIAGDYVASITADIKYNSPDSDRIIADVERRARFWSPPFEYYPGTTVGGLAHSDESLPSLAQLQALARVREIPPFAIVEALEFRGLMKRGRCRALPICLSQAISKFQSALGFEPTGFLAPQQAVRLIQMSAIDGDAESQDRLGIMYAKGVGVPQNFQRAEKWFLMAANQRNGDALYNLGVLYRVGPNGIDQDKDKAVRFFTDAAVAGFNPVRCELQDLLAQANDAGHHDAARR